VSTDANPALDGAQVVLDTNSRATVEYEYPGRPVGVRILSFSEEGTAGSEQLIPIVVQP
jgi:hypothetical protein